jgi:hypothetical protein
MTNEYLIFNVRLRRIDFRLNDSHFQIKFHAGSKSVYKDDGAKRLPELFISHYSFFIFKRSYLKFEIFDQRFSQGVV